MPTSRRLAQRLDDGRGRLGDLGRQARAVGVAERHVLGAGRDRRPQALERVAADRPARRRRSARRRRPPACRGARGSDRVDDHRQVLLAGDLGHLLEVERPRLADQGADGGEAWRPASAAPVVLRGGHVAPAGHPEGAHLRLLELDLGEQPEQLLLLRVGAREAGLDVVDPEPVERAGRRAPSRPPTATCPDPACRRGGSCRRALPVSQ